jgi:hypothetical protein
MYAPRVSVPKSQGLASLQMSSRFGYGRAIEYSTTDKISQSWLARFRLTPVNQVNPKINYILHCSESRDRAQEGHGRTG